MIAPFSSSAAWSRAPSACSSAFLQCGTALPSFGPRALKFGATVKWTYFPGSSVVRTSLTFSSSRIVSAKSSLSAPPRTTIASLSGWRTFSLLSFLTRSPSATRSRASPIDLRSSSSFRSFRSAG